MSRPIFSDRSSWDHASESPPLESSSCSRVNHRSAWDLPLKFLFCAYILILFHSSFASAVDDIVTNGLAPRQMPRKGSVPVKSPMLSQVSSCIEPTNSQRDRGSDKLANDGQQLLIAEDPCFQEQFALVEQKANSGNTFWTMTRFATYAFELIRISEVPSPAHEGGSFVFLGSE